MPGGRPSNVYGRINPDSGLTTYGEILHFMEAGIWYRATELKECVPHLSTERVLSLLRIMASKGMLEEIKNTSPYPQVRVFWRKIV
jgi:hypothetical protein